MKHTTKTFYCSGKEFLKVTYTHIILGQDKLSTVHVALWRDVTWSASKIHTPCGQHSPPAQLKIGIEIKGYSEDHGFFRVSVSVINA